MSATPKVLIAPGSYKSTITSRDACEILRSAFNGELSNIELDSAVIADGGEGTLTAFETNFGGTVVDQCIVNGPMGQSAVARILWMDSKTVLIESSQSIGYSLVPHWQRDVWSASSAGLAEMIDSAVQAGAKHLIIATGDSIVMDVGIGLLDALGANMYAGSRKIGTPTTRDLASVTRIDTKNLKRFESITFEVLVDTFDYLCGPDGQSEVYGSQKGLQLEDVPAMEAGIRHFASVIFECTDKDITRLPMATGSGGVAGSIHAFFGAPLIHTPAYLDAKIDLTRRIRMADIVITGEGRLDEQTRWGKIPWYVAARCNGRLIAIVGDATDQGIADMEQVSGRKPEMVYLVDRTAETSASDCFARAAAGVVNQIVTEGSR